MPTCPDCKYDYYPTPRGCPECDKKSDIRRAFNKVGHPELPKNPSYREIAQWLRDKAVWEELQPSGQEMNARAWSSACLKCAAEDVDAAAEEQ